MTRDNWLVKILNVSGKSLPSIQREVKEMMRECDLQYGGGKHRRYISYRVSSKLIRKAAMQTGAFGGLVSVPAILPGIGTLGTLFVGITADIAYLVRTQIALCYAISIAYEVLMDEDELKAVSLALLGFSGSAEAVKGIAVRGLRGIVDEITAGYLRKGISESAADISNRLLPRIMGKAYRIIPFISIPLSASLNIASTMVVGNQARKYFSAWDEFPEALHAKTINIE